MESRRIKNLGRTKTLLFGLALSALFIGCGQSEKTGATVGTSLLPPEAPSNLNVTYIGGTQISLTWTDNSNSEDKFVIERSAGASDFAQVGFVSKNETTFIDTGLVPFTTYSYRTQAANPVGVSTFSNDAKVTTISAVDPTKVVYSLMELAGPMIIGNTIPVAGSPETIVAPFNVTLKDASNQPIPNRPVMLDFTSTPSLHLMTEQELGTTVNCTNHTLTVTTDSWGVASFRPRFGGYIETAAVSVIVEANVIGSALATSTDLDGVGGTNTADYDLCSPLIGRHTGTAQDLDADGIGSSNDLSVLLQAISASTMYSYCP